MICRNCGNELQKNMKYCMYCGMAVKNKTTKNRGKKWIVLAVVCALLMVMAGGAGFYFLSSKTPENEQQLDTYFISNFPWGSSCTEAEAWMEENGYEYTCYDGVSPSIEFKFKTSDKWDCQIWNVGGYDSGGLNVCSATLSGARNWEEIYEKCNSELREIYGEQSASTDLMCEYSGNDVIVGMRKIGDMIQCDIRTYAVRNSLNHPEDLDLDSSDYNSDSDGYDSDWDSDYYDSDLEEIPSVYYSVHLQDVGWTDIMQDGETAGTVGEGRRLEAVIINLEDEFGDSEVCYRACVAEKGWLDWCSSGEKAGTENESRLMEALQIELESDFKEKYELNYRVHIQNIGWTDWLNSGDIAGTEGSGLRIEAVEITLTSK